VDTDEIARDLTRSNGLAISAIRERFGSVVINEDGSLNRGVMRELAFREPAHKAALESILHPLIRTEVSRRTHVAILAKVPYVLLDVPLLFESITYRERVHETLVVDCPVDLQISRVQHRNGLSVAEAERIIAMQIPRALRLQLADRVVVNNADLDALDAPVKLLHARFISMAKTA
jgi:dephospho-CoA kinase